MFQFYADKNQLTLHHREPLTSGSVNVYAARFGFSPHWDGLTRTAVFRTTGEPVSVLLDDTGTCQIPWEVLTQCGVRLRAGVYGTRDGEIVLPTVWADCGYILEGAAPGENARPPTPALWQQALSRKADALGYTEKGELGLYAGDKLLSAVKVSGGGEGGTAYGIGHGLKLVGGDLTVDTAEDFSGDNTLPITAAAVQTTVGNIELLLGTI